MRVRDALDQLDEIHAHLAKAEVYRGFRAPAVALTGVLGLVAALLQPAGDPRGFVLYWVAVALAGGLLGGGTALFAYLFREDEFARRRTRNVLAQFVPCLAAGGLVTAGLARGSPEFVPLLPGLWAALFGLGLVSARPYLPRGVGRVGLLYVAAGGLLLARPAADLPGWSVGGVFGIGHLITAWVLHAGAGRTDG
ncbi:MAG: hypothetical protein K2P78_11680 [Gemmataceae bacterium]|nr:hypothetical protein [Gemmataceae bacterium]